MHRGVKRKSDLRYDITIIPPQMLGKEFVKTKGHEHSDEQELYIVLEGKAIFLLQKYKNKKVEDVYAVIAKKGDLCLIPFDYGHVTINPSRQKLTLANWIPEKNKSSYSLFEKMQGACYYYTSKGWIKNKKYKKIPTLRFEKPLKSAPKNLNFFRYEQD